MLSTQPSPKTWILRFKSHRTTILLHVDPLQTFSTIKAELLKALEQTHRDGTLDGHPIPKNCDEILLARPRDHNDLNLGFEPIESVLDDESDSVVGTGKGKGKAAATTSKGRPAKGQLKDCPQGVGLRDHGVIAFRFRRKEDEVMPSAEMDEDDEGIAVSKEDMQVEEEWDVVVPSFEETYGEEP
jgi:hypothetical protein